MAQGDFLLDLGDGEKRQLNCSRIKHLLELEELCNASVMVILNRLRDSTWGVRDVREPIRLGLIGGGAPEEKAAVLTMKFADRRSDGLIGAAPYAAVIVAKALAGEALDQPLGKPSADQSEAGKSASSEASSSDSATS